MQNPWRRAGAKSGTVALLLVVTLVAALLAAGVTLPFVSIAGIATRDASNTFLGLDVGVLGQAPARSTLYDSEGQVIAYYYPNQIYRVPVSYNNIAPVMRDAIVAIEDNGFWNQGALDFRGTVRALASDLGGGQTQGGSTLAQQYVKNVRLLLANTAAQQEAVINETVSRKIQELRIAANVEHQISLQDLLADYLNVAFYGEHAYGIQVAAQVYFSEPASQLTLPQAAMLAGIVQSPTAYDPVLNPSAAKDRRNEVLTRMAALHYITQAQATEAENSPIKLKLSQAPLDTGCISPQAAAAGFFCDYVQNVLQRDHPDVWKEINSGAGGLKIYTTLNMKDQIAADNAVSYVMPHYSTVYNPNRNADTEVMIQPGTGAVRAIAVDRRFGNQSGEEEVDYAVNATYGGGAGVQTGSSSKIFTLITALEKGYPFGHTIKVTSPTTVGPYYNCQGQFAGNFHLTNAEGPTKGTQIWPLYAATVASINVYFAHLEQQVGLCNVVKTAVAMGMTRADGKSLLKPVGKPGWLSYQPPADDITSFTLGSVAVSPMSMAAAYASVAARGWYCPPTVLTKIVVAATGQQLKLRPNHCYRDMPQGVADAANYILQGVLNNPLGTAAGHGIGRPAAGKTGTADSGYYAAFAGYTPTLAAYVSVFNPIDPTSPAGQMLGGTNACYRDVGSAYPSCPGQMYGDNAPRATWEESFLSAQLGAPLNFFAPPSQYFSQGPGAAPKVVNPPKKKKKGGPGGPPTPTPTPTH